MRHVYIIVIIVYYLLILCFFHASSVPARHSLLVQDPKNRMEELSAEEMGSVVASFEGYSCFHDLFWVEKGMFQKRSRCRFLIVCHNQYKNHIHFMNDPMPDNDFFFTSSSDYRKARFKNKHLVGSMGMGSMDSMGSSSDGYHGIVSYFQLNQDGMDVRKGIQSYAALLKDGNKSKLFISVLMGSREESRVVLHVLQDEGFRVQKFILLDMWMIALMDVMVLWRLWRYFGTTVAVKRWWKLKYLVVIAEKR